MTVSILKTLRIYTLAFPVWSVYIFLLLKFSLIAYLIRRNGIPTSLWKSTLAKIVSCSTTLYFVYLLGVENCIYSFHLYHGNWVCIYFSIIWFLLIIFFLHNQLIDFYSLLASGCCFGHAFGCQANYFSLDGTFSVCLETCKISHFSLSTFIPRFYSQCILEVSENLNHGLRSSAQINILLYLFN